MLIGDNETSHKALRVRKVFGGGMRQAGYLAAAGIYALDNQLQRLEEDHNRAKEIGQALQALAYVKKVEPIETNIVIFEIDQSQTTTDIFLKKLEEKNIQIIGMGQGKLRMVTHMDYTEAMHQRFMDILGDL